MTFTTFPLTFTKYRRERSERTTSWLFDFRRKAKLRRWGPPPETRYLQENRNGSRLWRAATSAISIAKNSHSPIVLGELCNADCTMNVSRQRRTRSHTHTYRNHNKQDAGVLLPITKRVSVPPVNKYGVG